MCPSLPPTARALTGGLHRFLDDARTLAQFENTRIVKVYRFFRAFGTGYIVMDYAEGETLAAHIEGHGKLDEKTLGPILEPILDGLKLVH